MRRVVIHLHGSSSDTTSLASAIDFCRKLNARLSVVFIRRTREFIPAPADGIPGAFYETEAEAAPDEAQAAEPEASTEQAENDAEAAAEADQQDNSEKESSA